MKKKFLTILTLIILTTSSFLIINTSADSLNDNTPPNTPTDPNPEDEANNVNINTILSWTGGDPDIGDTVTYDVYLGTDPSPDEDELKTENQPDTTYTPDNLEYDTFYYWMIVARDNHNAETSKTFSFKTEENNNHPPNTPNNPTPNHQATNIDIDTTLSWNGGDQDPYDTVTYTIYLDTDANLGYNDIVKEEHSSTTYTTGELEYNTKYYWKIKATDNHQESTESNIFEFTTEEEIIQRFKVNIENIYNKTVKVEIENNGNTDLDNIEYNLTVGGYFFKEVNCSKEGTINLLETENTVTIETPELNGFDLLIFTVNITVGEETIKEQRLGIILLDFIFLFD